MPGHEALDLISSTEYDKNGVMGLKMDASHRAEALRDRLTTIKSHHACHQGMGRGGEPLTSCSQPEFGETTTDQPNKSSGPI